jgi:hypothetical protein
MRRAQQGKGKAQRSFHKKRHSSSKERQNCEGQKHACPRTQGVNSHQLDRLTPDLEMPPMTAKELLSVGDGCRHNIHRTSTDINGQSSRMPENGEGVDNVRK